jgi:hypothetical protein
MKFCLCFLNTIKYIHFLLSYLYFFFLCDLHKWVIEKRHIVYYFRILYQLRYEINKMIMSITHFEDLSTVLMNIRY